MHGCKLGWTKLFVGLFLLLDLSQPNSHLWGQQAGSAPRQLDPPTYQTFEPIVPRPTPPPELRELPPVEPASASSSLHLTEPHGSNSLRPETSVPPAAEPSWPSETAAIPVNPVQPAMTVEVAEQVISLTPADVSAWVEKVQASTELAEDQKKEASERLKSAAEWLKTAADAEAKSKEYLSEIEKAPAAVEESKAAMAVPLGEPQINVPLDTPLSQIEQAAAEADTRLKQARDTLAKREDSIKRRADRKAELAKLISELDQRFDEAKKQLTEVKSDAGLVETARVMEIQARYLAFDRQKTLYPVERRRIDARTELLPLQRDLAKRQVAQLEKETAQWQKFVVEYRKRESDRQAAETRRHVQDAHPALRSLAEQNAQLAEQRTEWVASIESLEKEVSKSQEVAKKLKTDFDRMVEKVDRVGHSTTIGLLLRRQREQLPDVSNCHNRIYFVRQETPRTHLSALELQEQRDALGDLDTAVTEVVEQLNGVLTKYDPQYVTQMVRDLLQTKRDVLDKLIHDHDQYVKLLGDLELSQSTLLDQSSAFLTYIDERVLWIRSSEPLGRNDINDAVTGLTAFAQIGQWRELSGALWVHVMERPSRSILGLCAILLFAVFHGRLRRHVNHICDRAPEEQHRFLPTAQAIFAVTTFAAIWPALMWFVGWQLTTAWSIPEEGRAFGAGLQSAAFLLWLTKVIRRVCRADGVGQQHFGWDGESMRHLRKHLTWFATCGIPLVIFIAGTAVYEDGRYASSLGRLGFLAGCTICILFSHALLRSRGGVLDAPCRAVPDAWFCRIRKLTYLLGIATPVALAILALLGYDYSAQRLSARLQPTAAIIFAAIILRTITHRWLAIRRARILHTIQLAEQQLAAETQAREAAAQAAAAAASTEGSLTDTANLAASAQRDVQLAAESPDRPDNAGDEEVPNDVKIATEPVAVTEFVEGVTDEEGRIGPTYEDPETALENTDAQVRYLLRYAVAALLLIGGYWVWSDVTPALGVLDEITCWSKFVDVKEMMPDVDGTMKLTTIQKEVPTTLKHVLLAAFTAVLGFVLARNLPALLDALILERMPIDRGQRYAAGLLLRYATMLIGMIIACRELGLTWSSIQWLAAAMTVGLGFGLQEIFANLVSGLIILFERPIRVGDLVTVGGVSGRVTRMQIRATTITDFDRRELIVPNKKFITEDVMNWTLSDDINRVIVEVGVAYGTDTNLARELLLKVAASHPLVLAEPAPTATFDRFDTSALNFTVRCFLPNLDNRLSVIHELHAAIDRAFREADIEIAFPQQDLHLRTVDKSLSQVLAEAEKAA